MKYFSFPIYIYIYIYFPPAKERFLCCVSIFITSCNSVHIFSNLKLATFQHIPHKLVHAVMVSIQTLPDDFKQLKFDRSVR
jgi:hypothetical protein